MNVLRTYPQEEINPITWIVVADARQAHIYSRCTLHGAQTLAPVTKAICKKLFSHETHRPCTDEIFEDASPACRMAEIRHHCIVEAEECFVEHLSDKLKIAFNKGLFNRLILIAPAMISSELKKQLPGEVSQVIATEIHRKLTNVPVDMLSRYLARNSVI